MSALRLAFPAMGLVALLALSDPCQAQVPAWPAPVRGYVPVKPGEHPRLFFRRSDLPALRQQAATPEGKMIVERCRALLGVDGHPQTPYTLWHGAAAGFLYQITGEKRYADLARQYVDQAWEGKRDKDNRYGLNPPMEPMRAGPSLSAVAMAYDLCHDAWDEAYRRQQVEKMMTWKGNCTKRGGEMSLERLATDPDCPNPVTNHYALQVGGAGLTILAIRGDPGADEAKLARYQEGVDKAARKVMTEDFGEGGYFGEHAGPGVIASTWTFIPWLQAERVCAGRDWISPRPNGEWISLRFVMQTIPTPRGPAYTNPNPQGGYGTEYLVQNGGHHATYFCQGLGAIQEKHRPAMLWVYQNFVEPSEHKLYPNELKAGQKSFDVFSYPHRAMFALVNWPWGIQPENPAKTLPKVAEDRRMGQYVFRNRWQDGDDCIVAVLFGSRTADRGVKRLMVWGLGQQMTFGNIAPSVEGSSKISKAKIDFFQPAEDGSGVVSAGGNAIGVDYSRASGADAVVVLVGPGATGALGGGVDKAKSKVAGVSAGGAAFSILTLSTGAHPQPRAEGDAVVLGGQTVRYDGKKIVFGKMAGPPAERR